MKIEYKVRINTLDKVKKFAAICDSFKCEIDLMSGRYVVDAKSIMGIFSLDLTKDLIVKIRSTDNGELVRFFEEMRDFIVHD